MQSTHVHVLVIGSGTAGSNAARAAVKAGSGSVLLVQPATLMNTCVEEGCMPSKSILAGAHHHESLARVTTLRNQHIDRLRKSLADSLLTQGYEIIAGTAAFVNDTTVKISNGPDTRTITADAIVIATGSTPFIPPIKGLETIPERMFLSQDIVSKSAKLTTIPRRVITVGAGPIGLELSTFLHGMGSQVEVLQFGTALPAYDPEFGEERVRASEDGDSFPIHINSTLAAVEQKDNELVCIIKGPEGEYTKTCDAILVATGRKPNLDSLALENTTIARNERGGIEHSETLQTSVPHIYVAGDVVGHHQILHFAAEMGKVAGRNAATFGEATTMDYDRHMLAVSFDQYPSAMIGLTETEARKRGMDVVVATKYFKDFGLGILKRQEYGLWKLVAERATGRIIGSQILGPDSAGELIQILVPILANHNTADQVRNMTWYHPTYGEAVQSLANMIEKERN